MEIIPAIDIIDGKCVRLTQGDYTQKKEYHANPVEVAGRFEDAGITRLHLVDLDGAKQKRIINLKVLNEIAAQTSLQIDFGGGVQSADDLELAFANGAHQITGGSIAVKDPEMFQNWVKNHGPEKIILGADVKSGYIAISGWQERSETKLFDFLEYYTQRSIKYVICTDVSKDGLLAGPAIELYKKIIQQFPDLYLIASGGVTTLRDLDKLKSIGVSGVIIGKAIYEGKITLKELNEFMRHQ